MSLLWGGNEPQDSQESRSCSVRGCRCPAEVSLILGPPARVFGICRKHVQESQSERQQKQGAIILRNRP